MLLCAGARGLLIVGLITTVSLGVTDPVGDTVEFVDPPVDMVRADLDWGPGELAGTIEFYPTPVIDGELLVIVNLDLDQDPLTGRTSHIADFWLDDVPPLGADYTVYIFQEGILLLTRIQDGIEQDVLFGQAYTVWPEVSFSLPREVFDPSFTDNCLNYTVVAGTFGGFSDRIPNSATPLDACAPDFNEDGVIDDEDVAFMADCRTGPAIPNTVPACMKADLDSDGDIDQDDFGIFQRQRVH